MSRSGKLNPAYRHGHGLRKGQSSEYRSWKHMTQRCANPNDRKYSSYGGRGIRVCQRWLNFENFLQDMGRKPGLDYSIERLNNDGNYELGNCKWATRHEQANNRRNSRIIMLDGERFTLTQLATKHGLTGSCLRNRLRRGWDIETAVTKAV